MYLKSDIPVLLLSFLIGIIFTVFFLGISNIGLTNTEWFNSYDLKSDLLAFKFFVKDIWRFPVGLNPNYGEILNSIVFSGAVPILSIISKIFRSILPQDFHFFSIWIFICFSFQFFFGYKIIYYLTKNKLYSFFSGIFFLLSPTFIYRLDLHLSLGAHWLILNYLYLDINKNQKYLFIKKVILISISSLVHFYFTIILIILNIFFSFFDNALRISSNFFKENLVIISFLVLIMYIVGYFHIPATDSLGYGYGYYKSNLLSLIDPSSSEISTSWSTILPDISNTIGEHEGFAYLGFGIIILLIYLIIKNIKKIKIYNINFKYLSVCIFLFLLALSNNIDFGKINLVNLNLPNFIYAPLSIIRASGRLIWPIYYIILIFTFYKLYQTETQKHFIIILIILSIQIYDFYKSINVKFINPKINYSNNLPNDIWNFISKNYENISTTNLSNRSNSFGYISTFLINNDFKSTNYFRLGRYNRELASFYRSNFIKNLNLNKINENKAYIIENLDQLRHLKLIFSDSEHGFFFRDGLWILLPKNKKIMSESDLSFFNNIKLRTIDFEEVNISQNSNDSILGLGWSHPSYARNLANQGAWSEGYFSSLIFNIENNKINFVDIILDKVFSDKDDILRIEVFINDIKFKDFSLNQDSKEISLQNIKEYLRIGENKITFKILNPSTPLSRLISVDGRLLGILIKKVKFY